MHVQPSDALPKIMLARYYGANIGRLLSVDPLPDSANPMIPQSWNRYSYAWNNPMVLVDPTGMKVVLTGETAEDREKELGAIKDSLQDEEAADQLTIEEEENEDGSTSYVVAVEGDMGSFMGSSSTAETIGQAIGAKGTIEFGFGEVGSKFGGAKTENLGGGNSRITVDPNQLPSMAGGVPQTTRTAIQHEFGHALYNDRPKNAPLFSQPGLSNQRALGTENAARAWYTQRAIARFGPDSMAATSAGRIYMQRKEH